MDAREKPCERRLATSDEYGEESGVLARELAKVVVRSAE